MKRKSKIADELINKLMKWRHSGFSVDNGKRIQKDNREGTEAIAQYMMRNVFNTENINYIEKTKFLSFIIFNKEMGIKDKDAAVTVIHRSIHEVFQYLYKNKHRVNEKAVLKELVTMLQKYLT